MVNHHVPFAIGYFRHPRYGSHPSLEEYLISWITEPRIVQFVFVRRCIYCIYIYIFPEIPNIHMFPPTYPYYSKVTRPTTQLSGPPATPLVRLWSSEFLCQGMSRLGFFGGGSLVTKLKSIKQIEYLMEISIKDGNIKEIKIYFPRYVHQETSVTIFHIVHVFRQNIGRSWILTLGLNYILEFSNLFPSL